MTATAFETWQNVSTNNSWHTHTHTLEDAAVQTFDGEIENMYRLLTDDDVSSAESTRIKRRLERDGVDVETLLSDFVTYEAIGTYLKFLGEFRTLADIKVVF